MTYLDIWKEYGFKDVSLTAPSLWEQYKARLLYLERQGRI
jgi:hypothetical protein